MSDKQIQNREFEFPTAPLGVFNQLKQVEDEIRRLESLKKKLRKYLGTAIPVEDTPDGQRVGEFEGVRRVSFPRKTVSYAKALDEVVEKLVPKTKSPEVEKIVESHTKHMWIDKFHEVEEEDY